MIISNIKRTWLLLICISFISSHTASGQRGIDLRQLRGGDLNAINTAVPFITITPDSRAGALGDAGVATHPDVSSQHWNIAKYAFIEEDGGFGISYTPWLRNLIGDINLAYVSTYYKPSREQVVSGSLKYFSLGSITLTTDQGDPITQISPFEMAIDAGYTRLFTDNLSGGIAFRYIYSNLTMGFSAGAADESKPGMAVAADLGFYYHKDLYLNGTDGGYAWGISLTNLGTPISYTGLEEPMPLPSNMRVGGRFDYDLDDYNSMSFSLEFNKLLVPTDPVVDNANPDSVIRGMDTPPSIVQGMIQSFYDAPGISYDDGTYSSVLREELAEVMVSLGVEYWYQKQFAIRAGYFHETSIKGNRKYATLGVGMKLNVFSLDFAYLIPTNGQQSPLANTLRFTLGFDFESLKL
ncbi:MAG TPA: type IX secretion system outer membrane channel protein PorV [Bacteroidales bacterium]|nr:type IX secretion system outer membrane channel protein PorV [Bacteroidales bacterium]